MSTDLQRHVTLRLTRGYEIVAQFDDVDRAPSMLLDEPAPLGEDRGPNAAALLGAAVGDCLASSLLFCLRKSRAEVGNLTAHVTTNLARNEKGRLRIAGIEVELEPEVGAADETRMTRCGELFEDFCTVTASIRRGIPVHVSVKPLVADGAAEQSPAA